MHDHTSTRLASMTNQCAHRKIHGIPNQNLLECPLIACNGLSSPFPSGTLGLGISLVHHLQLSQREYVAHPRTRCATPFQCHVETSSACAAGRLDPTPHATAGLWYLPEAQRECKRCNTNNQATNPEVQYMCMPPIPTTDSHLDRFHHQRVPNQS